MRKEVRASFGTWSDYRQEVEQMLDAGEDVVVVLGERGTGREPCSHGPAHRVVFTVRDELIIRQTPHREPEDVAAGRGRD
jgi:hypothetical protein